MIELKDGRGIISLGDMFGPLSCQHRLTKGRRKGCSCKKNSWEIILGKGEVENLPPELSGADLIHHVCQNQIGRVLCSRHRPNVELAIR